MRQLQLGGTQISARLAQLGHGVVGKARIADQAQQRKRSVDFAESIDTGIQSRIRQLVVVQVQVAQRLIALAHLLLALRHYGAIVLFILGLIRLTDKQQQPQKSQFTPTQSQQKRLDTSSTNGMSGTNSVATAASPI